MPAPVVPPVSPSPARKPRRWLRRLAIASGAALVLLITAYFVLTSAAFFKGVILPKVGQAMHATVTVSDASISPFSRVILKDLKVQTTGTEPLVTASEARAQYSLWAILRGHLKINEVAIHSPVVTVVVQPDGTSNLDPLKGASADAAGKEKPAPPSRPSQPPQLDLTKFALNNASVRLITLQTNGRRDRVEVSKLNITLDNLKNGQAGKMAMSADLLVDKQAGPPAANASLQGQFVYQADVVLGQDLSLSSLKATGRLSVPQATGSLSEAKDFSLSFDTDLSADPAKQSAVLRSFKLNAGRRDTVLLQSAQSGPITVSWGAGAPSASDATFSLVLTNLNLAEWRGLAPDLDPVGQAHGTLQLTSEQSGKNLRLNLAVAVTGLGAKVGSNAVANLQLTTTAAAQVRDGRKIELPGYRLTLAGPQGSLVSLNGTLTADTQQNTADVEARLEANLPGLLALMPQPDLTLKSGQAQLRAKVARRNQSLGLTGVCQLQSLTGKFGERPFQNLALDTTYDVALPDPHQIDLRQLQLALSPTERARTNAATLTGRVDLSKPQALAGALKLTADTLDVTPYYDLFAESPTASTPSTRPPSGPSSSPAPKSSAPAPAPPEAEPPPMNLPVQLLTADIKIDRCYLRELVLSEFNAAARIESNRVTLNPVSTLLNGSPLTVAGDLNLGVPGYQYDIRFDANRLPLEPIANSFSPTYRGQAKGEILAAFNLKGTGITGPSLQKNLGGALQVSFTNAQIQLVGPKAKTLLTPIAVGLGYPEIFQSPLRWLDANAKISDGKLQLSQFSLVSPAFIAGTRGEIPFAARIGESPIRDWPVDFALPRALAERLKLTPKDAQATNDFVPLPNLVKAVGTLGNASTKVDAVALVQFGARTLTEIPGVGKDATKLINQADSLLGGRLTGRTNTASTNAPSTNENTLRKLGDLLKPKPK